MVVFGDPRPAQAFAPAVPLVAGTAARTVLGPAARAACGAQCRGAAAAGAAAAAEAICSWVSDACDFPWEQSPEHAPNSDQPLPSGGVWSGDGYVGTPYNRSYTSASGDCVTFTGYYSVCFSGAVSGATSGTLTARLSGVTDAGSQWPATVRMYCTATGGQSGPTLEIDPLVSLSGSLDFGGCYAGADPAPVHNVSVIFGGGPTATLILNGQGDTAIPDPLRQAQAYKRCGDAATGEVVLVAGAHTTYRESEGTRSVPMPACPASHPYAQGGGIVDGHPWTPGEIIGAPGTSTGPGTPGWPAPVTPDYRPMPERLPLAPTSPQQPTRTMPGDPAPHAPGGPAPARPLPATNPDGSPALDPVTGQPIEQPMPDPVPDEGHCTWGGYAVDPADCDGLPAPGTTSTPTVQPSPSPSSTTPMPTSGPNPVPEDGTGPSCLSAMWSWNPVDWVYVPVKCALQWAFVPSSATTATLAELQADAAGRAPMVWLVDAGGWVGTVLGAGGGGSACWVLDVHLGMFGDIHILNSCADEPVVNEIKKLRPLLLVATYVAFLGPLAWWAWRSYAPLSRPQG